MNRNSQYEIKHSVFKRYLPSWISKMPLIRLLKFCLLSFEIIKTISSLELLNLELSQAKRLMFLIIAGQEMFIRIQTEAWDNSFPTLIVMWSCLTNMEAEKNWEKISLSFTYRPIKKLCTVILIVTTGNKSSFTKMPTGELLRKIFYWQALKNFI